MTFKTFRDYGTFGVVAVFDNMSFNGNHEAVFNLASLEERIRNIKEESPGYDLGPECAALVELRKRNAKLTTAIAKAEPTA